MSTIAKTFTTSPVALYSWNLFKHYNTQSICLHY